MKSNLIDLVHREIIGFQKHFQQFDQVTYPPHNVVKTGEGYVLELACAGFQKSQLEVHETDYGLEVVGTRDQDETKVYLFQGIARRGFKKSFPLAPHISVDKVTYDSGMLYIHLSENLGHNHKITIE